MKPSLLQSLTSKIQDKAVALTLKYYERLILPQHQGRVSLLDSKKAEFRLRKQLLNPITCQKMLEEATPEEKFKLEKLIKTTSLSNLQNFTYSFDRHRDMYGYKTSNFPQSYHPKVSAINFAQDPDWSVKLLTPRFNFKRWILLLVFGYLILKYQVRRVEYFD